MRAIKWIFSILGVLMVVAIGAAGFIAATFDPNDYKTLAIEKAREQGWDLAIEGDLSLSFWPRIAIDLPPTQVSSLTANQSVAVQDAQVSLAVMPLITQQRAEVSTLILNKPVIRWDLDSPLTTTSPSTGAGSEDAGSSNALALAIGGVQLTDADIQLFQGSQPVHDLKIPSITLGAIAPETWVTLSAQLTYANPTLDPIDLTLNGEIKLPADFTRVAARNLQLNTLGVNLSGQLEVALEPLAISGNLALAPFNARTLAQRLGVTLDTQNPEALSQVSLNATLGEKGPIYARNLTVKFDDTQFTGEAGLTSLNPLNFNLVLNGDQLKLDDYLANTTGAAPASEGVTTDAVSPLAGLAGINGDARITLASLTVQGLNLSSLETVAEIRDRRIHLTQLAANAYQGQLLGNAVINGRTSIPSLSADIELSSLQIQGLLRDLADFSDLTGTAALKTSLTANGLDADSVMASLTGTASGELLNGGYKGIAVDSLICDGVATLMGGQSKLAGGDTAFDAVRFNTDITQGVANIDTLKLGLANLAVNGAGIVNLPQQTLDLGLQAALTGDKSITGCAIPSLIANATLPLRCQGNFSDDPTSLCGFDSGSAAGQGLAGQVQNQLKAAEDQAKAALQAQEDELKAKTQAKIDEKKAELSDELKAKATDKLKGLFK
ncbi:MAG: AsmA family protein [Litorivicinus sp.]